MAGGQEVRFTGKSKSQRNTEARDYPVRETNVVQSPKRRWEDAAELGLGVSWHCWRQEISPYVISIILGSDIQPLLPHFES
jgi:hypothetical protein